ncbi:hypothetical protein L6452_22045 [Arctium lappa]|uniref:Uncharacterized protein n=1 Tax=Arctium lappa TaxID=4217 RepID=A0ACB9AZ31_ARCLA|nr:hypothetical protein L6452_22045 [Arctium lappa]
MEAKVDQTSFVAETLWNFGTATLRSEGWGHHFVSKRKYHFIIPINNEWIKPLDNGVLDLQTHILHGLIHCNDFGHLLCINGSEGGSNFVRGRDVMELWDRNSSKRRKISVVDTSKKRKMDIRLLYGVSSMSTWFGRWDYRFCHGSFGVTKDKYDEALQKLSSPKLDSIVNNLQNSFVKEIICRYRNLSRRKLLTIQDLFSFMLGLKFPTPGMKNIDQPKPKSNLTEREEDSRKFGAAAAENKGRWPVKKLEEVAGVVIGVLKAKIAENGNGNRRISWQVLRDTAGIVNTGLIDLLLSLLDDVTVGGYMVCRAKNSCTGLLEYRFKRSQTARVDSIKIRKRLIRVESTRYLGAMTVLDSKNFTKEWLPDDYDDEFLRLICHLLVPTGRRNSVGEQLLIPFNATIGDLKLAAEIALRDTYCVMESLKVSEIVKFEGLSDTEMILDTSLQSGSVISVCGSGVDLLTASGLNYEGGADNWVVKLQMWGLGLRRRADGRTLTMSMKYLGEIRRIILVALCEKQIVIVANATTHSGPLVSSSEVIVYALVKQIFHGIREYFLASAELKFSCFFLMSVADKLPALLQEDLESAFKDDLDNVFDITHLRHSLGYQK